MKHKLITLAALALVSSACMAQSDFDQAPIKRSCTIGFIQAADQADSVQDVRAATIARNTALTLAREQATAVPDSHQMTLSPRA